MEGVVNLDPNRRGSRNGSLRYDVPLPNFRDSAHELADCNIAARRSICQSLGPSRTESMQFAASSHIKCKSPLCRSEKPSSFRNVNPTTGIRQTSIHRHLASVMASPVSGQPLSATNLKKETASGRFFRPQFPLDAFMAGSGVQQIKTPWRRPQIHAVRGCQFATRVDGRPEGVAPHPALSVQLREISPPSTCVRQTRPQAHEFAPGLLGRKQWSRGTL